MSQRLVWPETSGEKAPYADIEQVLGDGDNPEIETQAVMIKYDLQDEFEAETLTEASGFKLRGLQETSGFTQTAGLYH